MLTSVGLEIMYGLIVDCRWIGEGYAANGQSVPEEQCWHARKIACTLTESFPLILPKSSLESSLLRQTENEYVDLVKRQDKKAIEELDNVPKLIEAALKGTGAPTLSEQVLLAAPVVCKALSRVASHVAAKDARLMTVTVLKSVIVVVVE